ncbi:hypothetical protein AMATHDRAFT_151152 [Amanita thiersii Skay4041]|uniref:DUF202 domain-containing protein n=1 Tax=Amanita thiersii Skay4041 TaxID=703135 RepID=A0A2A9NCP6_9AGAR|nr:hypothetical protein AMATHDRAFT_151152 [Amanita thiersii Skay4041]
MPSPSQSHESSTSQSQDDASPIHQRDRDDSPSFFRRSIHAMLELFHPFSASALATLPRLSRPLRYTRRDAVPETIPDVDGNLPTVRDYHSINSVPPQVRVPKKVPTPVRVEAKVWFANERTWISWLNNAILLSAFSLALFNASKDEIAKRFAYTYALISLGTLVYAYALYQRRLTMILRRDPGHFDARIGPIIVSITLFTAILANFIIRGKSSFYSLPLSNHQSIPCSSPSFYAPTS